MAGIIPPKSGHSASALNVEPAQASDLSAPSTSSPLRRPEPTEEVRFLLSYPSVSAVNRLRP